MGQESMRREGTLNTPPSPSQADVRQSPQADTREQRPNEQRERGREEQDARETARQADERAFQR